MMKTAKRKGEGATPEKMNLRLSAAVACCIAALLLFPLVAGAASDLAAISGRVHDSGGLPLAGALVIVAPASPGFAERIALTDKDGAFSVLNLFAGQYTVKVSMPRFLPAMKQGVHLNAGATAVLTVNLQNALDVVRRAVSGDKSQSDDIVWTLRSSRSAQPVLRLVGDQQRPDAFKLPFGPDYTGYFQVYSKSVETSAGIAEGVGSQFSVTMPLDLKTKVTVQGQYNESPLLPRGVGASYDFVPATHRKAAVDLNVRQGALIADSLQTDFLREVQLKYGEDFQWSDHVVLSYGAEAGLASAAATHATYLRPRFGVSWVPQRRTTINLYATSQAPAAADDPIRGKDYFDRTLLLPPALERYAHVEAGLTRIVSDVELSAGVFHDRTDTEALFVSTADGRHGVLILDTGNLPTQGLRLNVNRPFHGFEAGLGYTSVSGPGIDVQAPSFDEMKEKLIRRRFQSVAARFKADVDMTQTQITAVYRWNSGFSASPLDPYQRAMEYNDPTLSVSIAQNLPTIRIFPGKFQAILDARNLLDQSLGAAARTQVGQYPRLVKGGINIKF
jgi:hypothetical protein